MKDIIIRKMKPKDIPGVRKTAEKSWHSTYEDIIPREVREKFLKAAYNDEMLKRRMERSLVFVAEKEKEVIGFANFSPLQENGTAELAAIYLIPEYQGKGIGTRLLETGKEELTGVQKIFVNVEKENQTGLHFYLAKGFQKVSEMDGTFEGYILKTIRMALNLEN